MAFRIDPVWIGKTVVIIAGGESVTARQARHVAIARMEDRCRVLAVNDAVYLAWYADWLHAYDSRWWRWHSQRLGEFKGIKTTVQEETPDACVTGKLVRSGIDGFDRSPWAVRGNNSGYQAICIAMHAGANRILLLGFDMSGGHWFGAHPDGRNDDRSAVMRLHFATLNEFALERGCKILNCSPQSSLDCFPQNDLELCL